jgi:hypothetical protein
MSMSFISISGGFKFHFSMRLGGLQGSVIVSPNTGREEKEISCFQDDGVRLSHVYFDSNMDVG